MDLSEKIALFEDLSEDEKTKLKEKFIVTLTLIPYDDMHKIYDYLKEQGVKITRASYIKVFCNQLYEITKKFDILKEINETGLYLENPIRINNNVIDIYRRIKYCRQNDIPYKDGNKYEKFLFSEVDFQNMVKGRVPENNFEQNENILINNEKNNEEIILEPANDEKEEIDLSSYMDGTELDEGIADLESAKEDLTEAKTTNFADIRNDLERELANLNELKNNSSNEMVSFDEIMPEIYEDSYEGMRRAA